MQDGFRNLILNRILMRIDKAYVIALKMSYDNAMQDIRELKSEKENLAELNRKQSKAFKSTMKDYRELLRDYMKMGEENRKLKEDVEYFRTIYLDLKNLCEKE